MKRFFLLCLIFTAAYSYAIESPEMVKVKAGSYIMGKENAHDVSLSEFYISRYEVTVNEWLLYCNNTGYKFNFDSSVLREYLPDIIDEDKNLPIFSVTWIEAVEFCNWLSKEEGFIPVYEIIVADEENDILKVNWNKKANGYRLPTEAEWEYAARGGTLSSGVSNTSLKTYAWYLENSDFKPHPVGSLKANELGLYDMLGNVSEWCWDFFDIDYYKKSSKYNPTGPDKGYAPNYYEYDGWQPIVKVIRGGAWSYPAKWISEYSRAGVHFYQRNKIGFRIVRSETIEDEK